MFKRLAATAMQPGGPGLTDADVLVLEMAAVDYGKWRLANATINDADDIAGGLAVEVETQAGTKITTSPYAAQLHHFETAFIKRLLDLRLIRVAETKQQKPAQPATPETDQPTGRLLRLRIH